MNSFRSAFSIYTVLEKLCGLPQFECFSQVIFNFGKYSLIKKMANLIEEYCSICYKTETNERVIDHSKNEFGNIVCFKCQGALRKYDSTNEAIALYVALKKNRVLAELEKYDGYKRIDIAIPKYRINIEVDGVQHNVNFNQAMSDLQRTYHSFQKGYYTLRIPNKLVRENLEETADYITEMIRKRKEELENEKELQKHLQRGHINSRLLIEFLSHFQNVFESDWIYTQSYISELGTQSLLSYDLDDSNWKSRDALIQSYRNILVRLSEKEVEEIQKMFRC